MGKLFGKKKNTNKDNGKGAKQDVKPEIKQKMKPALKETAAPNAKQVAAIMVFSLQPAANIQTLIKQISDHQRSLGNALAQKCLVKGGTVKNMNDKRNFYAAIKKEFPNATPEDIIARTNIYPFQGSDGNNGKYCVVFDRA